MARMAAKIFALVPPLLIKKNNFNSGLLFTKQTAWKDHELTIIAELAGCYQHAWSALKNKNHRGLKGIRFTKKQTKITMASIAVALILLFLIPIRQSVLAPAEIAAKNPIVVSATVDGVIEKIFVEPNQFAKKNTLLFRLDSITLRNHHEQAEKAFLVAKEKYRKAYQHAFSDPESKAQLPILRTEVAKQLAEMNYTRSLLSRVEIRAHQDGIVIYSSIKDWIGKPVKVGERVMLIANPDKKELDIELPVDNAISLKPGSRIKLYLNVDPFNSITATLRYASYSAEPQADGQLSYHLKADFNPGEKIPRIGLKGTAKIYGKKVSLFYYIFWRPISYLRRTFGL